MTGIAVLYYNQLHETLGCLESIRAAGVDPRRVFVYDNGSLPEQSETVSRAFPEFRHMRSAANSGYSGGVNRALSWAYSEDCDSILFLTNDTRLESGALEACQAAARKTGSGLIAPLIVYRDDPLSVDSNGGWFDQSQCRLYHYRERNLPLLLDPERDYVPGTAFYLSREVFEGLGGMDESFHTYWEDSDFSFRAHRRGIPVARAESALVRHGVGKTCHGKAIYTAFYFQRNRVRFCKRHLSADQWVSAREVIGQDLSSFEQRWTEKKDSTRLDYLKTIRSELES